MRSPLDTRALASIPEQLLELESDVANLEEQLRESRPIDDQIKGKLRFVSTLEAYRAEGEGKLEGISYAIGHDGDTTSGLVGGIMQISISQVTVEGRVRACSTKLDKRIGRSCKIKLQDDARLCWY